MDDSQIENIVDTTKIDEFAQIRVLDENDKKEVISTIGTVPETSIYSFNFDMQTFSNVNINEQSGAKYSTYDDTTNTFSLAFEPDQSPIAYTYETNELLRVE